MNVTGVRVELPGPLRQFDVNRTFAHNSLIRLQTPDNLSVKTIGSTNGDSTFLEKFMPNLNEDKETAHLLYQSGIWNHDAFVLIFCHDVKLDK